MLLPVDLLGLLIYCIRSGDYSKHINIKPGDNKHCSRNGHLLRHLEHVSLLTSAMVNSE